MALEGVEELTILQKIVYFLALFTFTTGLLILAKIRQQREKAKKGPLKRQKIEEIQTLPYREKFQRDGFLPKKIPDDLDYIIIGSGVGGLTSAALLSRLGFKVLVLEQHDRAGGSMHVFDDKGFEFDTGIHYLGRGEKTQDFFSKLCHPSFQVEFVPMGTEENGHVFDKIYLGNHRYFEYRKGTFIDDLKKEFPDEIEAIEKYEKFIKLAHTFAKVWGATKVIQNFLSRWARKYFLWKHPEFAMPFGEFLDTLTDNIQLKQVLCGNFGDGGSFPSEISALLSLCIHGYYTPKGGCYPNGGPEQIVKGLIPVIERAGGRVLVKAEIKEIVIANGFCMGVKVGRKSTRKSEPTLISSKFGVISAAGHAVTRNLTNNFLPEFPMKKLHSTSHMSIFLGFEGTSEELNLCSENLWVMEGLKPDQSYDEFMKEFHNGPEMVEGKGLGFIGFPSKKDPSYHERCPNKSVAVVITEMPWDKVEEWKEEKCGKRDQDYQDYKKSYAEHVLETTFWHRFPHLKEKLIYFEVGTPLSSSYYYNQPRGSSYGMHFGVERITKSHLLAPRTNITNLYLTGQDIVTPGFAGGLESAKLTVADLLGYFDLSCILAGRSIEKDFRRMKPLKLRDFKTPYTAEMAEKMKNDSTEKKSSNEKLKFIKKRS